MTDLRIDTQSGLTEAIAHVRGTIRRYKGHVRRSKNNAFAELANFCHDNGNWETYSRAEFFKWWNDEF